MELRHLRYFVAVAEELNFTRAAQRLNTAQPSLSQQIKQLERHIGVALLDRGKRHVALTEAGRVFLREAREILQRTDHAVRLAMQADQMHGAELSLGVVPAAEVKLLPNLLLLLEQHMPQLRLVLHNLPSAEQKRAFASGSLDIGFLRGPLSEPNMETETILEESLVVGLLSTHALARKRGLTIPMLNEHPFIMISRSGSPELHDAVQSFCNRANLKSVVAQQADNVLGNLNLIRAGVGFGILPDYVSSILPKGVILKPLVWDPPPTVSLVMANRRGAAPDILPAFKKLVRQCFSESALASVRLRSS